jgi:hypothetical protein
MLIAWFYIAIWGASGAVGVAWHSRVVSVYVFLEFWYLREEWSMVTISERKGQGLGSRNENFDDFWKIFCQWNL